MKQYKSFLYNFWANTHKLYQVVAKPVSMNELLVLVFSGKLLKKRKTPTECECCNNVDEKNVLLKNTGELRQLQTNKF